MQAGTRYPAKAGYNDFITKKYSKRRPWQIKESVIGTKFQCGHWSEIYVLCWNAISRQKKYGVKWATEQLERKNAWAVRNPETASHTG